MSGPLPPPADHHVGAILALRLSLIARVESSTDAPNETLERALGGYYRIGPLSLAAQVAIVVVGDRVPTANRCREDLKRLVNKADCVEAAVLRAEEIIQIAEELNRHVDNPRLVAELETILTETVTARYLHGDVPPRFNLRVMARNLRANMQRPSVNER